MSRIDPFAYPAHPHVRRYAPTGYAEYQAYKPWLRDEFLFRCVYCLQREMWSRDRHAVFSVDHVMPQTSHPGLTCVYENLLYACVRCNSARQDTAVVDPTREAMGKHVQVGSEGVVDGLTEDGQVLVELLHLNAASVVKERLRVLRILTRYEERPDDRGVVVDYKETFGFPEDLPNLRVLKGGRVSNLDANRANCFHARRERGELPSVY